MSDNNTLLGYLVPKLPVSTENASVEALAFILNDSQAAMAAFNALVGEDVGVPIAPISRVASQATAKDGSRPDLVGFDDANERRVIVEGQVLGGAHRESAQPVPGTVARVGPGCPAFCGSGRENRLSVGRGNANFGASRA